MAKFLLPDEDDQRILKEMIRDFRNRRRNPQAQNVPPTDDPQSPETYIALAPVLGIPALTRVGTADVGGEGDTPGSADCDIYKIKTDGTLEKISTFSQTVYNLSTIDITQEWVLVSRTKFGVWIASTTEADTKVKEGFLLGTLVAATDVRDNPSTALLDVHAFPPIGTGSLESTGETVVVVNRFTEIETIVSGTWVVVIKLNEEWRPISADCGASVT